MSSQRRVSRRRRPPSRSSWTLAGPIALLAVMLLAGYGVWSATRGGDVEEIVVTPTRLTPTPATVAETAEVAAARTPGVEPTASARSGSLRRSRTIVPSLLLRVEPTTDAPALRLLAVDTPVLILNGGAAADGHNWVEVRLDDGTEGWLIAEGVE